MNDLSESDIEFLRKVYDPKLGYEPSEIEFRAKLGPNLAAKVRQFIAGNVKVYDFGCRGCGQPIDEGQITHCPACAELHRQDRDRHRAEVSHQRDREREALRALGYRGE